MTKLLIVSFIFTALSLYANNVKMHYDATLYGTDSSEGCFYLISVYLINEGDSVVFIPTGYKDGYKKANHPQIILYRFDVDCYVGGKIIKESMANIAAVGLNPGEMTRLQMVKYPCSYIEGAENKSVLIYQVSELFGKTYGTWSGELQTKLAFE